MGAMHEPKNNNDKEPKKGLSQKVSCRQPPQQTRYPMTIVIQWLNKQAPTTAKHLTEGGMDGYGTEKPNVRCRQSVRKKKGGC